ncbi:MAG: T9SS type B sorting domain-containing protein, partial [Flavobacteriaceae bacterium]|nr:T9SS type B sorting domain-containing protein [Flavobacteriaceae bacterium]
LRGAIKIAPGGNLLAIAHTLFQPNYMSSLYLYDFNRTSGEVTNPRDLSGGLLYYGIEFSANSQKMYASGKEIVAGGQETDRIIIEQFDLLAANVVNTRYEVLNRENFLAGNLAGSLQLGNDRKIYHSIPGGLLSVINAPENDNDDCDLRRDEVSLGGRNSSYGLPPFIQSYFESVVKIEDPCFMQATQFSFDSPDPINAVQWNFGDPASGAANTSTLSNPSHTFTSTGTFTVTLEVDYVNRADKTYIEFVEIAEVPILNSPVTLVQCDALGSDDGIALFDLRQSLGELLPNALGTSARFFETLVDAENNSNAIDAEAYQNTANGQTIYARVFQNNECYAIGEVMLQVVPMSFIEGYDLTVCNEISGINGAIIIQLEDLENGLNEEFPNADISFYTSTEDAMLEQQALVEVYETESADDTPEIFFRIEYDNACAVIGSFDLELKERPDLQDETVIICPGEETVELGIEDIYESYLWSTGADSPNILITEVGSYEVTVFNVADCSATKVFNVLEAIGPTIVEIEIDDFNDNSSISIQAANSEIYQYSLDQGALQDTAYFDNLLPGIYTVNIWENGCLVYSETVIVGGTPKLITPNNDGYHDTWKIVGLERHPSAKIFIFDRYGKLLKQLSPSSSGWDGTYQGALLPSSDYWYRIELDDGRTVKGHFTLKR